MRFDHVSNSRREPHATVAPKYFKPEIALPSSCWNSDAMFLRAGAPSGYLAASAALAPDGRSLRNARIGGQYASQAF